MTAVVAVEPNKTSEIANEDLHTRVSLIQEGIEKLAASRTASRLRLENLTAERGSLVLAARSQKNDGAQKRLYAIDEELPVLKRDITDDEVALSELRVQLTSAKNELERAEWESERSELRKLVQARMQGKGALKLEKIADEFAAALEAATVEDEQIWAKLIAFEPSLLSEAAPLGKLARHRGHVLAMKFLDHLPIDTTDANPQILRRYNIREADRQPFGPILGALDRLQLVLEGEGTEAI